MATKPILIAATSWLLLALTLTSTSASDPCTGYSASLAMGDRVLFFFGTEYASFDTTTHSLRGSGFVTSLFEGFPEGLPVTAAYRPPQSKTNDILVVSGDEYYIVREQKVVHEEGKPLKIIFPRHKNFAKGLDAVATFQKVTYYFRECTINRRARSGARRLIDIRKFNLPCDIDAAWNEPEGVIVAKGPFVWKLDMINQKSRLHCFFCNPVVDNPEEQGKIVPIAK